MEIILNNWEQYDPKRAQKTYTWLRLDNDFFIDDALFDLNPAQKLAWITILCLASKKNTKKLTFKSSYLSHITGVCVNDIYSMMEILNDNGTIDVLQSDTLQSTTPDYTRLHQTTPSTTPTNERKKEKNERKNETLTSFPTVCDNAKDFDQLCQSIMDSWNLIFTNSIIPKVAKLTSKRKNILKKSINENLEMKELDSWILYFEEIIKCDFLMGYKNGGWKVNFDWAISYGNILKVSEGNYKNNSNTKLDKLVDLVKSNPFV